MKDSHLALRLPADLERALARAARARGLAKSQLVREAVARYLAPPAAEGDRRVTARAFADRWPALPRLTPEEAAALADEIVAGRAALPPVVPPWE